MKGPRERHKTRFNIFLETKDFILIDFQRTKVDFKYRNTKLYFFLQSTSRRQSQSTTGSSKPPPPTFLVTNCIQSRNRIHRNSLGIVNSITKHNVKSKVGMITLGMWYKLIGWKNWKTCTNYVDPPFYVMKVHFNWKEMIF